MAVSTGGAVTGRHLPHTAFDTLCSAQVLGTGPKAYDPFTYSFIYLSVYFHK